MANEQLRQLERELRACYDHATREQYYDELQRSQQCPPIDLLPGYFQAMQDRGFTVMADIHLLLPDEYERIERLARQYEQTAGAFVRNSANSWNGLITKINKPNRTPFKGKLHVPGFPVLEKFLVPFSPLTHITFSPDLERLSMIDLRSTKLTRETLRELEFPPSLEVLGLCGKYVTAKDIDDLQSRYPQLTIQTELFVWE